MSNIFKYKGYLGSFEYDESIEGFHGRVQLINDVVTFEGEGAKELQQAFRDSVDVYLEWCAERDEEPEKPFSGTLSLRLPPELHRRIAMAAVLRGVPSLNKFIELQLEEAISGD